MVGLLFAPLMLGGSDRAAVLPPDPCLGCVKRPLTDEGSNPQKIDVVADLSIHNGDCAGDLPNCTEDGCDFDASVVKIKNVSGASLYFTVGLATTEIMDGETRDFNYHSGELACGAATVIVFFDAKTGGNLVATWGWRCSGCPETGGDG
jgi:hypothetical protein